MRNVFFLSLTALAAATTVYAGDYKVTVPLGADDEGAMAYLVNYDTGVNIDSVLVEDTTAVFCGRVDVPILARVIVDGDRRGQFILEDGTYTYRRGQTIQTPFNLKEAEIAEYIRDASQRLRATKDEDEQKRIYKAVTAHLDSVMRANIDNIIGYTLFLDQAYEMEPSEVEDLVEQHPSMKQYMRVRKLLDANRAKAETQPGGMFRDFEISYDGVTHRLSDVVGRGGYVLVDFWASWCGPCIRQTSVIKDLYNEFKDKGLRVLGVAVWDEPDNTRKAIKDHDLPWECWLNGQTIPTDVYGISGIPCIILFGPDGKILSRDKQDDDLKADVRAALQAAH